MLRKYPGLYLADTQVSCKPLSYDNMVFSVEDQQITLEMKWSCSVSLEVAPGSTYTFISTTVCKQTLSLPSHTKPQFMPATIFRSTKNQSNWSTSTSTSSTSISSKTLSSPRKPLTSAFSSLERGLLEAFSRSKRVVPRCRSPRTASGLVDLLECHYHSYFIIMSSIRDFQGQQPITGIISNIVHLST